MQNIAKMVCVENHTVAPLPVHSVDNKAKTEIGCIYHHTTLPLFCYAFENKKNTQNTDNYDYNFSYGCANGFTSTVMENLTSTFCASVACRGFFNMNARMYDPMIGRFLSPDPYVQEPDFSQSYNRYSYCINNPLKYTDPTGEWFGIDDLIGFVIGGTINLISNAIQGNIHSFGNGLAAFGAGGAAGTLALYGPAGWVAGGAIVGGTNAWLGGATGWDIAKGAGIGAISGLAGGAAGQWAAGAISPALSSISSPVLQGAITGVVGGGVGGFAGGFTGGLLMTGNLGQALNSGFQGMAIGMGIGGAVGAGYGYKNAIDNNLNPWTGKPNAIEAPQQTPYQKGLEGVNRAEQDIISQGGTPLTREVTLEVNGVRVRVDIAADFNGEIHLIEVKNGPSAGFTQNQSIAYPQMTDGVRVPVIPRGNNALSLTPYGWQIGQPTTQYRLIIIRY